MKGCCEIYDNVFIGADATILSDVAIGPNAVVAAGAVVTKDVLPGTVVAGIPAKVIGSFDDFVAKRAAYGEEYRGLAVKERNEKEWESFYKTHPKI